MYTWWLLGLLVLYFVAGRYHPGLVLAATSAFVGFLLLFFPTASAALWFAGGFGETKPYVTWLLIFVMWALFYVLNVAAVGTIRLTPANVEAERQHPDVIEGWARFGFTQWRAWRPRSGRSLIFAFGRPQGATIIVLQRHGVGWKSSALSSLSQGRARVQTTRESLGLQDPGELFQIVQASDPAEQVAIHEDAIDYLQSEGVQVDTLDMMDMADYLVEEQRRSRAAALRFPIGLLRSMFRPIFHVGRLRTRPSRRWQVDQLRA